MASRRPTVIQVDNETTSSACRVTQEGKQITYRLKVLQQPARARACGAGAKSSADRRPVDPPPIVELKIFDGEGTDSDITFHMNANYFLFATLEQARPIAHGRVPDDKQQRLTVLTGTPVAGMVYLDRPEPAGYFIFPDLSVRHEGKYRLSFSLYEELKDVKDDTKSEASGIRAGSPADAHVTHRLEVKSEPFTVYSAKKFPGLTESTALSRMVADQGCRVRIRRDVRMRRRETKSGKDWDEYEDETAQARARLSATPDVPFRDPSLPSTHGFIDPVARPRSASNASHQSLIAPLSRRTSSHDMAQGFQPFGTAPHTPQNVYAHSPQYGPPPNQLYPQPAYMPQQPPAPSSMHPPPPHYPQQSYQPPPATGPPQSEYYDYAPPRPPPAQYPQTSPTAEFSRIPRMSVDYSSHLPTDSRRPSAAYTAALPPPPPPVHYPSQPPTHPFTPTHTYQPAPPLPRPQHGMYLEYQGQQPIFGAQDSFASRALPPQPVQPPARATGASTPLSTSRLSFDQRTKPQLPPIQIPDMSGAIDPSPSQSMPSDALLPTISVHDSRKRHHGSVFREPHQYEPMRQGARPTDTYATSPIAIGNDADDCDTAEGSTFPGKVMEYRRANGLHMKRMLPRHSGE
ncbi:hypothetical protein BAUCODRAFT_467987 [Baudoinia panamericana UAMH 10762]|uniref:Velvet domain-containing protein n=1 Tax=Baudoinia panamericana (strain UAMH 10762) TaxID=717646 RepID=M2NBK3_BAUPA|nr:uncharacterized protein BAUCODRAFT_467987 [Baudoinia panamericana UAMH 10762]EMC96285.1 hypothetical protein BAUCODRAFT_467987 [Baudoinia panamericana UAMH 10762]